MQSCSPKALLHTINTHKNINGDANTLPALFQRLARRFLHAIRAKNHHPGLPRPSAVITIPIKPDSLLHERAMPVQDRQDATFTSPRSFISGSPAFTRQAQTTDQPD